MELIQQEYRKMFLKKSLLVVLIVLSAINAIKIGTDYKYNAYYGGSSVKTQNEKVAYSRLYSEEYSGHITDEKISRLMDYINSHYSLPMIKLRISTNTSVEHGLEIITHIISSCIYRINTLMNTGDMLIELLKRLLKM